MSRPGTKVSVTSSLASRDRSSNGAAVLRRDRDELLVMVVGSMLLLITAMIWALSGTPVCALLGLMVVTATGLVTALVPV